MAEKIGGVEGTMIDPDFRDLENRADLTTKAIETVSEQMKEVLQPNPATRAKMQLSNTLNKAQGQAKTRHYQQPEGTLGETMYKLGKDLQAGSEPSAFGESLENAGEAFKQLAEIKYGLESQVSQVFLEPMAQLMSKDIRDMLHHRKKLEGRRLDFDCKKRRKEGGGTITDDEIRAAEAKFEESKALAEGTMYHLLDNEVEQVSQLCGLVDAMLDYHKNCADIISMLNSQLQVKRQEAAVKAQHVRRPQKVIPKIAPGSRRGSHEMSSSSHPNLQAVNGGNSQSYMPQQPNPQLSAPRNFQPSVSAPSSAQNSPAHVAKKATAKALYNFEPENDTELKFFEGDIIELTEKIDENWFEGVCRGKKGLFPSSYVQVMVELRK